MLFFFLLTRASDFYWDKNNSEGKYDQSVWFGELVPNFFQTSIFCQDLDRLRQRFFFFSLTFQMKNVKTVKLAAPEYDLPHAFGSEEWGEGKSLTFTQTHAHNTENNSHHSQFFWKLPNLYTKHITQIIPVIKI